MNEQTKRMLAEIDRLRAEIERLTNEEHGMAATYRQWQHRAEKAEAENERLRTLLLKHYLDPDEQVGDAIEELEAEAGAC